MTVNIGFIGVGGMAEAHIGKLLQIDHAHIAAVHDINRERCAEMADKYGAAAYDSAERLIASGTIDALFVCTPPFARGDIEEQAARKGVHLLVEKPVGLDMNEVRRKERAIRDGGIINTSGYCLRYMDIVFKAKSYLADKQIDLVMSYRFGGMPDVRWWRMMEMSGGQLVEQSTHQLDLIRYLAGEFKDVQAIHEQRSLRKIDPEATAYDVGTVSFTLRSGAIGNITSTCLANYVGRGGIEFFGSDFYLSIDGADLRIVDDGQDMTIKSSTDFYLEQDKAFVEAVRTGRQELLLGDYAEAARTLAVTLAANESAASRQPVALPDDEEEGAAC
ncbi:Gfo/Idh/MocA family protein [Cohnella nanjingensis]|uniref:Gfo/Idh/MocA family oxidoreductase n=1 Tax=Cohnella nanjingensis TaxID=1387779 RepID=A0A7X0RUJ1_9BACL|nr:Gfo/Idh/MocA family oxidoreductase [Cohnella nanjingensis]MBB6673791.1 Gfo/Idh/MocA family oxidoreductase [Cohnella nanjingensis]